MMKQVQGKGKLVLNCRSLRNSNLIYHLPCDKYPKEEDTYVGLDVTEISNLRRISSVSLNSNTEGTEK
jgi:hypothetical protein